MSALSLAAHCNHCSSSDRGAALAATSLANPTLTWTDSDAVTAMPSSTACSAGGSSASATAFPVSVEELTKEWLSLVVGAPIEGMAVVSCDAAGFVSETYTATLRYQEIGNTSEEVALLDYPTSVVVKMSGELEFPRRTG